MGLFANYKQGFICISRVIMLMHVMTRLGLDRQLIRILSLVVGYSRVLLLPIDMRVEIMLIRCDADL